MNELRFLPRSWSRKITSYILLSETGVFKVRFLSYCNFNFMLDEEMADHVIGIGAVIRYHLCLLTGLRCRYRKFSDQDTNIEFGIH